MNNLSGRVIRSYRLEKPIGSGGFGTVYRAFQSVVNREVAIKIILPAYANHPDFIRNFEVEAQLVASLEHPHIVPLYDFWREPDGAYLVMRWLRGGNLRMSLSTRIWSVEEVLQMLDQITGALTIAHRQGVVHQDIKLDNILLDEDNNAYLSDFGTAASLIGSRNPMDEKTVIGTPGYMAPEQIMGKAITPQSDIYSLGILLYEILAGKLPFTGRTTAQIISEQINDVIPPIRSLRLDLPTELNFVMWRATAKEPDRRYPDVITLAQAFRQAVEAHTAQPTIIQDEGNSSNNTIKLQSPGVELANPYKGLRAFEETDARDFFGREAASQELLEKLKKRTHTMDSDARFLALVGPSGSGKSSLVKAGLIPALRRGDLGGLNKPFIATMTPDFHPMEELKEALLRVASGSEILNELSEDENGLHKAVTQLLPNIDDTFVLFIDQFEEIFTLTEDENERLNFLNNLYHAVSASDGRLWVIITLRADFYDRPLLYSGMGDLFRKYTEVVLPLAPEELERAVSNPAERVGVKLEPGLVTTIVAEVNQQSGALPLLQYALTELFDRRENHVLTLKAYREIGGVLGSLTRRADELYQGFDLQSQNIARQLFLRLIALDEGGEVTRQRAMWSEWVSISGGSPRFQPIVDRLSRHRLLTLDRDPVTRAPTIQLAHEALVREWKQMQIWIDNSRDDLRLQRQLAVATAEWIRAECDDSYLASGTRLAQFEGFLSVEDISLSKDETDYLQSSLALRRRAAYRLRLLILSLIAFSVVALALAAFAFDRQNAAIVERDRADLQGRIARSRELSVTALLNQEQLDLSLLLSLEALRIANTFEARNSLLTALQSNPMLATYLRGHTDAVRTVAISPDGRWLASGGRDNNIILWDTMSLDAPVGEPLTGHLNWINSLEFSADSQMLVSGSADGTIRLWNIESRESIDNPLLGHDAAVWSAAFSPDGRTIASGGADNTIRLWDTEAGQPIGQPLSGHDDIVYSVAFSPDGRTIASGGADNTIRLWDAEARQPIGQPLEGHLNWVLTVAFSPEGTTLASSGADGSIILWNVETQMPVNQFASGHTNWVRKLVFSPDGRLLVSSSADGSSRLWDVETGQMIGAPLTGHLDAVWGAAFSPDGQTVATGSADSTVMLWDTDVQPALMRSQFAHQDMIASVVFSPDGNLLATAGGNVLETTLTDIQLWDVASGSLTGVLTGHEGPITSLAFSPEGHLLTSASADRTVIIWDVITHQQIVQLLGHTDVVWSVAFSPDGALIASSDDDGSIRLWDVGMGLLVDELVSEDNIIGIMSLAFSSDGKLLAAATREGAIVLWNIETRQPFGQPLIGHTDTITDLVFIPDTSLLISSSRDNTLILWDTAVQEALGKPFIGHSDWVLGAAITPDGQTLASGSRDRTIILWNMHLAHSLGEPFTGHTDWVNTVDFSPDGQILASGSSDAFTIIWDVSAQSWQARACEIANRNLSEDEWQRFFPGSTYHETCLSSQ